MHLHLHVYSRDDALLIDELDLELIGVYGEIGDGYYQFVGESSDGTALYEVRVPLTAETVKAFDGSVTS